jgi:hypothetical protein
MGEPLKDIGNSIYLLVHLNDYPKGHHPENDQFIKVFYILVSILPFWWRFWQCINKFYFTGLKAHLINAGKYFSKLVPPFILLFYPTGKNSDCEMFWLFCLFNTIATLYCTVWDYYMDWGLIRSTEPGKLGLRPKIKYPAKFYYVAMVVNLILRFYWVVGVFTINIDLALLTFFSMMAEALRRT